MSNRLTWTGADGLDPTIAAHLLGPGAPFELVDGDVHGTTMAVFAQRAHSLIDIARGAAQRMPAQRYLVFPDRTVTYGDVAIPVAAAAAALEQRFGVKRGDRVAIAAANCLEYAVTTWAAMSLGAITVALNGWWTAPEMAYAIELTAPTVVFADERRMVRMSGIDSVPVALFDGQWWGPEPATADWQSVDIAEDDPYLILFTSGTTGRPKGAVLSHRSTIHFILSAIAGGAIAGARAAGAGLTPSPQASQSPPCTLSASPMFHVAGMTAQLLLAPAMGQTVVYPPPGRWDEITHFRLTEEHRVTSWSLVPTQLWRLIDHPALNDYDLSSLLSVGGGSAVWPPELLRRARERIPNANVALRLGYGMTETTGTGTSLGPPFMEQFPNSVGVAGAGAEVEVRDPDGTTALGEGEVGEVCIRTAARFLRYWENPDATAKAFDDDGFYRTGDFGRIEHGLLFLEGRRSDLVIRGGENIYPVEIENRLAEHPGIGDAVVIGVDHPTLGQELKAVVVRSDASLTADDVRAWIGDVLAPFKVPAHVEFVAEMPRNAMGKVVKYQLTAAAGAAPGAEAALAPFEAE